MGRRTRVVVCVAFLVALVTPLLALATGLGRFQAIENRGITPLPSLTPRAMLRPATYGALNLFLTDRLPWRDRAITSRERLSLSAFGETASEKVVLGADGWRYLAAAVSAPCLTAQQLGQVRAALTELRARFAAMGKRFGLVVAPDKATVYPERLPAALRRTSCVDANTAALQAAVRDTTTPGYGTVVERARGGHDLYFRADTHWNDRGALIAAQDLVDLLRPGLFDPGAYRATPGGERRVGDLLRLEGVRGVETADRLDFVGANATPTTTEGQAAPTVLRRRETRAGEGLVPGRVLVVGDSFSYAWERLASPWFGDVTWLQFSDDVVVDELAAEVRDADVVVVEVAERALVARLGGLVRAARLAAAP
jgi:alginate O-acetyltransferase complex protein AlgJ